MFETSYVYSSSQSRRAYLQRNWYDMRGWLIGWALVLVVVVAGMFSAAYRLPSVFLAGFFCGPCFLIVRAYIRAGSSYAGGTITVRMSEEGVSFSSALVESSMPWSAFSKAHLTRDFVLLAWGRGRTTLIPRAALNEDAMAFIQEKLATRWSDIGTPRPWQPPKARR